MRILLSLLWTALLFRSAAAQPLRIDWQKCLGGSGREGMDNNQSLGIRPTDDGGFIVGATTDSRDGDVTNPHGDSDFWIVKLDARGSIQWQRTFGGSNADVLQGIAPTSDGGFIAVGTTQSVDGDLTGSVLTGDPSRTPRVPGQDDAWVIKLDAGGALQWHRVYGTTGATPDWLYSVVQNSDGNYAVAGYTNSDFRSFDPPTSQANAGGSAAWVLILDRTDGRILRQEVFGGQGEEGAFGILQSRDGGFLLTGFTTSDFGATDDSARDLMALKVDGSLQRQWMRVLVGDHADEAYSALQNDRGEFVLVGYTKSATGDVHIDPAHDPASHDSDAVVADLDETTGRVMWMRTLGGSGGERASGIVEGPGRYLVAAWTTSVDGDVTPRGCIGSENGWVLELDKNDGRLRWERVLGGSGPEKTLAVAAAGRGGFVVAGSTRSPDDPGCPSADVRGFHGGGDDVWVIRLHPGR